MEVKNELNISEDVILHLKQKEVFKTDDIHFSSGSKRRPSKYKLILANVLFAMKDDITNAVDGYMNINVQDDDKVWIEYVSELITLYIDESIIGGYKFEYTNEHLFKVSENLYFKNLKFKFASL
ncbi:hypothetical protein ACFSQ3_14705 [Sphingobacterium corticis]|uniref:DUF3168 domain-containing protein n=1 Tax=Sphingobacterium corticis TaxID=1812823 RepID=A0ABW5NNE5_9SPHI